MPLIRSHTTQTQLERMDDHCNAGTFRNNNPLISPTGSSCPIYKLPAEILSYIFEYVADSLRSSITSDLEDITGEVYTEPQAIRQYETGDVVKPWLPVFHVCRNWHDVAISSPSLWGVIMIPPWYPLPLDRVARQLNRSKDVFPIDFQIHMTDACWAARDCVPRLCSLLLPHAYRWRSLEVRADLAMDMHTVLDAFFKTRIQIASQLTSVTLVCDDETSYLPASFGLSAPHLQTIRLLGVTVDWNQPWISSASNLMTLHIRTNSSPSWTQFSTLLRGAPRLKVLILESKLLSNTWDDPNLGSMSKDHDMNPIKLLELRQLVISLPADMVTHLLRRCYIPDLRKLTLCGRFDDFEPPIAQLVAPQTAIETSSTQVQLPSTPEQSRSLLAGLDYICLDRLWRSSECIRSLYSNLNSLTLLVLRLYPGIHPAIDLLFRPSISCAILLPQLKTLSVYSYKDYWEQDAGSIVALARHRHDIGVPLSALLLRSVSRKAEIK
ncbi:hypothetical protein OG21DRAFT_1207003 [Imleria badia]|nr:hypothetical protein OG21DRAFT_1207003 [Imleria badia]